MNCLVLVFVASVPHRLRPCTLHGYGEHPDESRCLAWRHWSPLARIPHLSLSVVTAHLPEIPSRQDNAHQASSGYSWQQRLPVKEDSILKLQRKSSLVFFLVSVSISSKCDVLFFFKCRHINVVKEVLTLGYMVIFLCYGGT